MRLVEEVSETDQRNNSRYLRVSLQREQTSDFMED